MGKGDKSKGRLLKHHNLISSCFNICLFEHIWLEFNLIIKTIKILNWWWFYDGDDDDSDDDDDGDDGDDDVDDDDDDDDIYFLAFKLFTGFRELIKWLSPN